MDLNDGATLIGFATGVTGSLLGIMNYLRDRARVQIVLQWDTPVPGSTDKRCLVIVANTGRRPIWVRNVALRLPKGNPHGKYAINPKTMKGTKLEEGAEPLQTPFDQNALGSFAKEWKQIRAQVTDVTGKEWLSPRQWWKKRPTPSWVMTHTGSSK